MVPWLSRAKPAAVSHLYHPDHILAMSLCPQWRCPRSALRGVENVRYVRAAAEKVRPSAYRWFDKSRDTGSRKNYHLYISLLALLRLKLWLKLVLISLL